MLEVLYAASALATYWEAMMRFYDQQHRFTCGIDLHARTMHLCILDQAGAVVFDRNLACRPEALLRAIAPFREGLVIGAECMFAWYWVADLCVQHGIPFVLGHALYMKAVHGGKAKNDRIDAGKIARLLKGGNFPLAYAYPKGMRETRDLLRRRTYLVRKRAELLTHLQILNAQYNLAPFPKKLSFAANRLEMNIAERFGDPSVQKSAAWLWWIGSTSSSASWSSIWCGRRRWMMCRPIIGCRRCLASARCWR
jgi:transposase